MWTATLIIGGFFVAVVAIGWFGIQEGDRAALEPGRDSGYGPPEARAATSDQAVFEIEHRIDADLREVTSALRAPPERLRGVVGA